MSEWKEGGREGGREKMYMYWHVNIHVHYYPVTKPRSVH